MARTKPSDKPNWTAKSILAALKSLPAPLATPDQAELFSDATMAFQSAPRASRRSVLGPVCAELIRVVDATVAARGAKAFTDQVLFALKLLAYSGDPEGLDAVLRAARKPFATDAYLWSVVLAPFGEGHPGAERLFAELASPLPDKFMAICLLDAANEACREHGLKRHPFDSAEGGERLAKLLSSNRADQVSKAVSACAALPFLSEGRRAPLLDLARKHQDDTVRLEVAWAMAKLGDKGGLDGLVSMSLDPHSSAAAVAYLIELGRDELVPAPAREPDFRALAEMCSWLRHPMEFGEPPAKIEQIDTREIYWPPQKETRRVWLFRYEYPKGRGRSAKDVGVGMVGSITFALFDTTSAKMSPEEIYGLHCLWELEIGGEAGPSKKGKAGGMAGWRLIEAGPPARGGRAASSSKTKRKTTRKAKVKTTGKSKAGPKARAARRR